MKNKLGFLFSDRRLLGGAAVLGVFACVAAPGLYMGFGNLSDSEAIYYVYESILAGNYVPSRSFGFPLYEYIAAHILSTGGLSAVNVYSFIMTFFFVIGTYHLFKSSRHLTLWLSAVALHPIVVINATILMEISQSLALLVFVFIVAAKIDERETPGLNALLFVLNTLMLLTRIDWAFFSVAIAVALALKSGAGWKRRARGIAVMGASLLLTVVLYGLINGGMVAFFNPLVSSVVISEPLSRKVLRAVFGYVAMLGVPASLLMAWVVFVQLRVISAGIPRLCGLNFPARLLLFSLVLMTVRFIILPDKLEYILPLYMSFIYFLCHVRIGQKYAIGLVVCILSLNIVSFSLFKREGYAPLHLAFGVNKGALLQSYEMRQTKQLLTSDEFQSYFAGQKHRIADGIRISSDEICEFMPFDLMPKPHGVLVIPEYLSYRLVVSRFPMYPGISAFDEVAIIETNLIHFMRQKGRTSDKIISVSCDGREPWQRLQDYEGFAELWNVYHIGGNLRYRVIDARSIELPQKRPF